MRKSKNAIANRKSKNRKSAIAATVRLSLLAVMSLAAFAASAGGLRRGLALRSIAAGGGGPYAFVERIHFNGTDYVDTGLKANTTRTRFVGAFAFDDFAASRGLLGSRNAAVANDGACNLFILASGAIRLDWPDAGTQQSPTLAAGERIEVDVSRPTATVGDWTRTYAATASVDQTGNFLIGNFTNGSGGAFSAGLVGWVYECRIYHDGEVVRHYRPCVRRSDGAAGFYEDVSGAFVAAGETGNEE